MSHFFVDASRAAIDFISRTSLSHRRDDVVVSDMQMGDLHARLFQPEKRIDARPLIFFHGGGFVYGSLDSHDSMCAYLSVSCGLEVYSVDYRLAPEHAPPAQIDDAVAACHWALANLNVAEIFVGGDSAGGYLAARASSILNKEGIRPVAGQLLFYPFVEMRPDFWNSAFSAEAWHRSIASLVVHHVVDQLGGQGYPPLDADMYRAMPPTVVISGRMLDAVYPDVAMMCEALEKHGVPSSVRIFNGLPHGGLNFPGMSGYIERVLEISGEMSRELFGLPGR